MILLIILPCAGGSAYNYNKYKKKERETYIYEYPGHWSRYKEPLETSLEQIIFSLKGIIERLNSEKLYILGHSMGGLIAWELAQELIAEGVNVDGLYIAACCPPDIKPSCIENLHDDTDIKVLLGDLRQVPDRILNSLFFAEELFPIIRNDFTLVKNYIDEFCADRIKSVHIPITCLYGCDDPIVRVEEMLLWKKYTSNNFRCISFPGDHFFLYENDNVNKIEMLISNTL